MTVVAWLLAIFGFIVMFIVSLAGAMKSVAVRARGHVPLSARWSAVHRQQWSDDSATMLRVKDPSRARPVSRAIEEFGVSEHYRSRSLHDAASANQPPPTLRQDENDAMRLDIYVNYRGNCEQAFRFYEQHLAGRITGLVRHGEQPNPNLPPDWQDAILHARIEIGTTVLMGADIPHSEPMRSAYLALTVDSETEAERIYALFAEGGQIFMKLEKTPFANRFAMLRDRFGTSWMLLHQPEAT